MGLTRRAALAGAAWALPVPLRLQAAPAPSKNWDEIGGIARDAVARRWTPGLSLAVQHGGTLVYEQGFGFADLENPAPMRAGSICKIGSLTKQFTAAAILKLEEAGKLSVDDKVARFYPDFPRGGAISLRQLLTHTSGLGNYTNTSPPDAFIQNARRDYSDAEMLKVVLGASPLFLTPPGEAFAYSNSGYVLLGLIVAKISGQSSHDFMRAALFEPLGLKHTAVDDMAELVPGRADGYAPDPVSPCGFDNASFISMTYPGGAGSLRSTAGDLCLWADGLLSGRVLKPAGLEAMLTPGRLNNGALPMRSGADGKTHAVRYGFGVIVEPLGGKTIVVHNGGIQGFMSMLRSVREDGVSVAVLCNAEGGPDLAQAMATLAETATRIALT